MTTTARARAKINLCLRVGDRRPDGYHEVLTLLHSVTLADTVMVEVGIQQSGPPFQIEVDCCPERHLSGPTNLAYRAAEAYLRAYSAASRDDGLRYSAVRITIDKRIPIAAGLGGGSADAAATLRALDHLLACCRGQLEAPESGLQLAQIAAGLGADVPFCVSGGAAWGTGRGDLLEPVRSCLCHPVLIAVPPFGVSSRDAYQWWDEDQSEGATASTLAKMAPPCPEPINSLDQIAPLVRNDLRPAVVARHPVIGDILEALHRLGARAAEMSGSGPATFALFEDTEEASGAAARLAADFPGVRVMCFNLDPAVRAAGEP
jgi:4-diphosphocytidyl-2-C-methyl-D-erythritol kinase